MSVKVDTMRRKSARSEVARTERVSSPPRCKNRTHNRGAQERGGGASNKGPTKGKRSSPEGGEGPCHMDSPTSPSGGGAGGSKLRDVGRTVSAEAATHYAALKNSDRAKQVRNPFRNT